MNNKRHIVSRLSLAAFSAFVSLYLVLFGPLDIYVQNRAEFSSSPVELFGVLLLLAVACFLLALTALFLIPGLFRNVSIRALAFLVLGSWVISNFFYGEYGRLDGTPLQIDAWSKLALVQSVALLLLLILVARLDINRVINLTGVVFLISLLSGAIGVFSLEQAGDEDVAAEWPASLTEFSPTRNVIHVVLDELGSDLFISAIESDENLRAAFDGFTVFRDTLSVYPSTEMSIAVLMTGEVYRNTSPKRAFLKRLSNQNKGIRRLESLGYEIDTHTSCQLGVLPHCTPSNTRILRENAADIEALQILDIFIFKSVPDYIKPRIYNHERWLLLDLSAHNSYLKSQSGIGHLLFTRFLEKISLSDDPAPRYKFFHSMVTHAPADLDAQCGLLRSSKPLGLTGVEFVKCGLGHFVTLLDELKTLDIYDQTMIVLSSDHGDHWHGGNLDIDEFARRGISERMVTRSIATLAIKPFDARGPVTMSDAPVSLRDIPQTILSAVGLGRQDDVSPGARDVFTVGESEDRQREFLHYVWDHDYWAKNRLPPVTTLKINGRIRDPRSWPDLGPLTQPAD